MHYERYRSTFVPRGWTCLAKLWQSKILNESIVHGQKGLGLKEAEDTNPTLNTQRRLRGSAEDIDECISYGAGSLELNAQKIGIQGGMALAE